MKCLYLVWILATIISKIYADTNVYKKDFDETGKVYYFNPSQDLKGKKIALAEDCTKIVITVQDASGQLIYPSAAAPLSILQGTYVVQKVRYPGGKCTLPDTQKYDKEVIKTSPDDLINYYNGKQAPLAKYTFETKNNSEGGPSFFGNKWVIIGIGSGALIIILGIIGLVVFSRRGDDDDNDYKRFSNDKEMKNISEPFMGLSNSDSKDRLINNDPFGSNSSMKTTPLTNYNNWNAKGIDEEDSYNNKNNNSDFLSAPAEPKRINSITFEEQQSYSKMLEKNMNNNQIPKSPSFKSNIPDEYEKFKTFRIVRKFTPQRNDELVVDIGNLVKMIKSFEDGWSLCYNIDTGKEGYIPKNKLMVVEKPQKPQNALYSDSSSVSSAYSTKPLLHSNSGASTNSYTNSPQIRSQGQRGVNIRNNSNSSRNGGQRGSPSPKSPANKYYRRPSNDNNYINNNYQRSPNQRYDM
ncbi:hypothetical protein BCR36DRAFT_369747 [Piromyces finnis]|uniref:SH3 domain-containing protein n=1 Tax=Piromyces finnis TaxID=1754191 RepID=A0A1Y1VCF9_9FUNG|nr:hypothetical protein BCR36DRAFT_369747 [Piromyces finnis]|eukprot:ORX51839.1 hypothetical protein BCR36DRAFT_369747 [Piromyces finnis]